MKDCNNCEYPRRCNPQSVNPCSKYVGPKEFKLPLLHHLVYSGKIDQAAELLGRFDIKVIDTDYYPYFKLELSR